MSASSARSIRRRGCLERALSKALRLERRGRRLLRPSPAPDLLTLRAGWSGAMSSPQAQLDFFHGFTPWIGARPAPPLRGLERLQPSATTSASTIRQRRSRAEDLARIEAAEARWLRGARRVLFTSDWAAQRASSTYQLDPARVGLVGIFGELEAPDRDAYAGSAAVRIRLDKLRGQGRAGGLGGLARRSAHAPPRRVGDRRRAGQSRPWTSRGSSYAGFLRKEDPSEHARFRQILGEAVAAIHPTTSDIAPLLLIEAGGVWVSRDRHPRLRDTGHRRRWRQRLAGRQSARPGLGGGRHAPVAGPNRRVRRHARRRLATGPRPAQQGEVRGDAAKPGGAGAGRNGAASREDPFPRGDRRRANVADADARAAAARP